MSGLNVNRTTVSVPSYSFSFANSRVFLPSVFLLIAFLSDIPYIGTRITFQNYLTLALYGCSALLILPLALSKRRIIKRKYIHICLYFLWLILITIINDGNAKGLVTTLVPPLCIGFLLAIVNREEIVVVLRVWCLGLLFALVVDLASMLIYPLGMYSTDLYSINWFLGYKTYRLEYTLPLLIFSSCLQYVKYGCLKLRFFIMCAAVVLDTYLSQAGGGLLCVVMFVVLAVFTSVDNNGIRKILHFVMNYKLAMAIYVVMLLVIVVFQTNTWLTESITSTLGKSDTFTGRAACWSNVLSYFAQINVVSGKGFLSTSEMLFATGGFYNTHNYLLNIILTSGVVGVVLLFLYFNPPHCSCKSNIDNIAQSGIYSFLLIGISSSALSFSPMLVTLPIIMDLQRSNQIEKEQSLSSVV